MGAHAIELHHVAIALNAVVLAVAILLVAVIVGTELRERRPARRRR